VLRAASLTEAKAIAEEDTMVRGGISDIRARQLAHEQSPKRLPPQHPAGAPPMSEQLIRVGYCLSLSGPLGSNGKTARVAHQIWEQDVNRKGGLLGRRDTGCAR
jgi:ABC-type branched-subunit amino acid transport system substrate-binding protein